MTRDDLHFFTGYFAGAAGMALALGFTGLMSGDVPSLSHVIGVLIGLAVLAALMVAFGRSRTKRSVER